MAGAWGYTVADCQAMIAQWAPSLTSTDLAGAEVNGVYYNRALGEVSDALLQAGYNVTEAQPIAYQRTHDLLTDGIALYYIETRRNASYPDGFDPLAGAWGRYRRCLRLITNGGAWGEFGSSSKAGGIAVFIEGWRPSLSINREL